MDDGRETESLSEDRMANGCHPEKEREKWHYGAGRQRKKERHFKDGEIQAWTSTGILRPNTEGGRRLKYKGQNVAITKRAEPAVIRAHSGSLVRERPGHVFISRWNHIINAINRFNRACPGSASIPPSISFKKKVACVLSTLHSAALRVCAGFQGELFWIKHSGRSHLWRQRCASALR